MTPVRRRALEILHTAGRDGIDAGSFGAELWRDVVRRERISSVNGGGDYAAQNYLGKLRKEGLAETCTNEGSSRWRLTSKGRQAIL